MTRHLKSLHLKSKKNCLESKLFKEESSPKINPKSFFLKRRIEILLIEILDANEPAKKKIKNIKLAVNEFIL